MTREVGWRAVSNPHKKLSHMSATTLFKVEFYMTFRVSSCSLSSRAKRLQRVPLNNFTDVNLLQPNVGSPNQPKLTHDT